jgi:hypothetical protein
MNDRREEFGTFIVWCGEEDQMRIMAMNKGSDVHAIWDLFYTGLQAVHEGVRARNVLCFFCVCMYHFFSIFFF